MDVETLFSVHYGVDVGATPYPVCRSLPSIRGIQRTNGVPNHIDSHTSVIAGLPKLVLTVETGEPVWQRNSRTTQGWSVMDSAAFQNGKDRQRYKGPGTVAKTPLSRGRRVASTVTTLQQTRAC